MGLYSVFKVLALPKILPWVGTDSGKHSSLLRYGVNNGEEKSFMKQAAGSAWKLQHCVCVPQNSNSFKPKIKHFILSKICFQNEKRSSLSLWW